MRAANPRAATAAATELPGPFHDDERLVGAAVMGLPFASGHYLALRDWSATSFADPYRAVFHRTPHGRWTIWSSAPAQNGCGRFWSAGVDEIVEVPIGVKWVDSLRLHIEIPEIAFDWTLTLGASFSTAMMTATSGVMPAWSWRNDPVLAVMGRISGPILGMGKMRLAGSLPNRQHYRMAPEKIWRIMGSSATLGDHDFGEVGPLDSQERLGDVWLPQGGLFAVGSVRADAYDPAIHFPASTTRSETAETSGGPG